MRIPGAQLVRDAMPEPGGGPPVTFLDLHTPQVIAGTGDKLMEGRARAPAFSLAIGLSGDAGYWIVPVGLEDPAVAGELTFEARAEFARDLSPGDVSVRFQAIDGDSRAGDPNEAVLRVLSPVPDGELVISLEWDRDADVDLYVTDPDGAEINPKNPNTYEPPGPGEPPDPPDAFEQGGILDADSLANCIPDGRRRENAVWANPPPPGRYRVAVDLASACGVARTSFRVEVRLFGELFRTAEGALYEIDARESASGGAAPLFVTEFDVP